MIRLLAFSSFRSLYDVVLPLDQLNVVVGGNGVGKSSLYRGLRLLAETAQGNVVGALAHEGGLPSALWAGPGVVSTRMLKGDVPIEPLAKGAKAARLQLGFATDELSYAIAFGYPLKSVGLPSAFDLDPEIKAECVWAGGLYRRASVLVHRAKGAVWVAQGGRQEVVAKQVPFYESMLHHLGAGVLYPEVQHIKSVMESWRFYDYFRTDRDAAVRQPQLGTRTAVLHHDGHDLAAALQTILEVGDAELLHASIDDAFPGSELRVEVNQGFFSVGLKQPGMLRPMGCAELSDGTLRFLLLAAALLTPRPPMLMVLNEPESSLHSDLLPALARLMLKASRVSQLWVISHSQKLVRWLEAEGGCNVIELEKFLGQTVVKGQGDPTSMVRPDVPKWHWPPS